MLLNLWSGNSHQQYYIWWPPPPPFEAILQKVKLIKRMWFQAMLRLVSWLLWNARSTEARKPCFHYQKDDSLQLWMALFPVYLSHGLDLSNIYYLEIMTYFIFYFFFTVKWSILIQLNCCEPYWNKSISSMAWNNTQKSPVCGLLDMLFPLPYVKQ